MELKARTLFAVAATAVMLTACTPETGSSPPSSSSQTTKAITPGDQGRGREIAAKWCIACHHLNAESASDQVPSFPAIARGARGGSDALRVFLNAPHAPMPPLQLTNQEIADLAAFIAGLR